jgi:hypothetical protein
MCDFQSFKTAVESARKAKRKYSELRNSTEVYQGNIENVKKCLEILPPEESEKVFAKYINDKQKCEIKCQEAHKEMQASAKEILKLTLVLLRNQFDYQPHANG